MNFSITNQYLAESLMNRTEMLVKNFHQVCPDDRVLPHTHWKTGSSYSVSLILKENSLKFLQRVILPLLMDQRVLKVGAD